MATRPKAKLLMDVRQNLERWPDGGKPDVGARDPTIRSARRFGLLVLEISYRTWKPVRLTQDQAKTLQQEGCFQVHCAKVWIFI